MKTNKFHLSKFLRLLAMLYYEGNHDHLFDKGICRALYVITEPIPDTAGIAAYLKFTEILQTTTPAPFYNGEYLNTTKWEERAFFCLVLAEWLESKNGRNFNYCFLPGGVGTEYVGFLKTN